MALYISKKVIYSFFAQSRNLSGGANSFIKFPRQKCPELSYFLIWFVCLKYEHNTKEAACRTPEE